MMPENARPTWSRFRLRTLFVVVTVICVWLAWQLSLVHQRQQLMQEMRTNQAFTIVTAEAEADRPGGNPPPTESGSISWFRQLLGDAPIAQIVYAPHESGYSREKLKQLESVFTEATVVQETPPEPCHPGCFPHGTLIHTPSGRRVIESIDIGEQVLVVGDDGKLQSRRVESVFRTTNWLWRISTDEGDFLTTETQPLCRTLDETIAAGELRPGDTILAWRERPTPLRVLRVAPTGVSRRVVNLVLGDVKFFVAGGLLARSKPPETLTTSR